MIRAVAELAASAKSLLEVVGDPSDLTLFRSWGNRGDNLIFAGTRRLLRDHSYRELDIRTLDQASEGTTAIITGGGAWCKPYHLIAETLPAVEARFSRVIVFPSSFDTEEAIVREVLSNTKAVVFARERESYERIRPLCDARLAHDAAFFFDFKPYQSGFHQGVLNAFRLDAEAGGAPIPEENRDISSDCDTLDEWLWTISRHDLIRTDRAHVVIAAAMLGKRVEYRSSSYHKVPAIVSFSISSGKVTLIEERSRGDSGSSGRADWSSPTNHATAEAAFKAEVGRLTTESTKMAESGGRLGAELAARMDGGTRLKSGNRRLAQRLAAREAELARIGAELQESRHAVTALRESWSWRLTSPLRLLLDSGRKLQRLLRGTN
jgi:hypothetical protein